MDDDTRAEMERRFDTDFSAVRVHTGGVADRAAKSIDAIAFTVGSSIVFSRTARALDRSARRSLLAHELAHVCQQRHHSGDPLIQRAVGFEFGSNWEVRDVSNDTPDQITQTISTA